MVLNSLKEINIKEKNTEKNVEISDQTIELLYTKFLSKLKKNMFY